MKNLIKGNNCESLRRLGIAKSSRNFLSMIFWTTIRYAELDPNIPEDEISKLKKISNECSFDFKKNSMDENEFLKKAKLFTAILEFVQKYYNNLKNQGWQLSL